jgi:hypothetical protein
VNGAMLVITQSRLTTSLSWWTTRRVEGNSVVLASSSDEGWPEANLIVAEHRSEVEAKEFFCKLNDRILRGAGWFDARNWPDLIRQGETDTKEGSGE